MNDTLALLGYALLGGTIGAVALRRARWPVRAPRLGVAAWQILSASVLLSVLLAGVTAIVPSAIVSTNIADLLQACAMALRAQYATPGGALLHALGATATLLLAVRAAYLLGTGLRAARQARDEHLTRLHLVAQRDPDLGAFVIDHPTAAAYCLPGRDRTVVLTTAALAVLGADELAAVLAHERAHLRGRHHLVLAAADALVRTAPFLPLFRWARAEQARLLEMIADDDAVDAGGQRLTVARALVNLAEGPAPVLGPAPAPALGAADVAALARVQRLVSPAHRLGLLRRTVIAVALALTATVPIAIAAAPAWAAIQADYCPVPGGPAGV